MKKSFVLLIALFFVVSCGGGGGETSNSAATNNGMSSAVLSEGVSHYKSLVSSGTDKDIAVSDTVNWFKKQEGVTDAYPAADNRNIFIKETNGITTLFVTNTFSNPSSSNAQSVINNITISNKSLSELMSSQNIKAIVMDPFNFPINDWIINSIVVNKVLSDYPNADVTYLKGPDVTPEILQNLSGYDLIYYVGHGGIDDRNGGIVYIGTGVPYSKLQEYVAKYHDVKQIYLGRVAPDSGGEYLGINSNFIKDYSKGLNATAVYADACQSLKSDTNDTMANAFMQNGAKSYLGWDGNVYPRLGLTSLVAKSFFTDILACKSVSEAFNHLPYDWNKTDLHYRGDGKLPICTPMPSIPSMPTGFTVTASSSSQINLAWTAPAVTVSGYKIYRSGTYLKSVTTTSTSDTGLSSSTNYCYAVTAYNSAGESAQTSQICATTQAPPLSPPSIPAGFTVTASSSSQINLSWNTSTGATGYKIYKDGSYLKTITPTSSSDTGLSPSTNYCYYVTAYNSAGESLPTNQECATTLGADPPAPTGMVLIPAGSFQMGDAIDGESSAMPVHTVTLSPFCLDKYEVTKALWDEVYAWATAHGYGFDNYWIGTAANHPVRAVSWADAIKWLNARSEKEGRTPVYYTDSGQATIYRTGRVNVAAGAVKWSANGYRLPTEAEWEYAARGGTTTRFYTGSCISTDQANYDGYYYPAGCPAGPYRAGTTVVGSFPANPWGLYDMAGNVSEWTWDWYGTYSSSAVTNPRGPSSGSSRVFRGGSYFDFWQPIRSANRGGGVPDFTDWPLGFRSALSQP